MNERELSYRNELKYAVSAGQILLLKSRVQPLLKPDRHADKDGSYQIRSLYFDDCYDSAFYDNENGVAPREKFRIRIYNGSADRIMLECKRKERGKTHKDACAVSRELTMALIAGQIPAVTEEQPPLLRKLLCLMLTRRLRPVVIVEYDRAAFVCKNGNVRVTFDTNITSSTDLDRFFEPGSHRRPVMPAGQHLLEVKYDDHLPDPIYGALSLGSLRQETFSKYYLCRKFMIKK
ncbi:MAG: polyphosphate polymerase domain-containing protein [Oscillospiraceae bacterium]|nr:polyphosphate polymerase domain-containing protein [Oscillospiraceae bacterium]